MENAQEKFAALNKEIYKLCSKNSLIHKKCIKLGRMECELLNFLSSIDVPVSMNEMARVLKVSHSRVTRIIDNLVKKKLVKRFPSKKDRRSWLCEITPLGLEANQDALNEFIEIQNRLIENAKGLKEVLDSKSFVKLSKNQLNTIKEISNHISAIKDYVEQMIEARKTANRIDDVYEKAKKLEQEHGKKIYEGLMMALDLKGSSEAAVKYLDIQYKAAMPIAVLDEHDTGVSIKKH